MADQKVKQIYDRRGAAWLARKAFEKANLNEIGADLTIQSLQNPEDAGLLHDLSGLEEIRGNHKLAHNYRMNAFSKAQVFRTKTDIKTRMRVLALASPINMGGNLPVDFLLEGSDVELLTLFVIPGMPLPDPLPDHDIAFVVAPGDSGPTLQYLEEIEQLSHSWPTSIMNDPARIKELERDQLCKKLSGLDGVVIGETHRKSRAILTDELCNSDIANTGLNYLDYPIVIRPVGSHAGLGLDVVQSNSELATYLTKWGGEEFFLSPFLDYRSGDGQFRKYRIVFIDGKPFPVHMAIAKQWKLWYLNAGMDRDPDKRAEEKTFMLDFDQDFAMRHADRFEQICSSVRLDYFGIDCAETRDGKLIVFEADNALIVHDMDPVDIFPYKHSVMRGLFSAFVDMLHVRRLASRTQQHPIPNRKSVKKPAKKVGRSRAA